jgi:hypothetical protein
MTRLPPELAYIIYCGQYTVTLRSATLRCIGCRDRLQRKSDTSFYCKDPNPHLRGFLKLLSDIRDQNWAGSQNCKKPQLLYLALGLKGPDSVVASEFAFFPANIYSHIFAPGIVIFGTLFAAVILMAETPFPGDHFDSRSCIGWRGLTF